MKKLILIKLGGGLITYKDRPYTIRLKVIKKLAKEIKKIISKKKDAFFIIGNGAGSFGHYEAVKYKISGGIKNENQKYGFAVVQNSVKVLNKIIVDELLKEKINVISIHQSSILTSINGKLKNIFTDSLEGFLNLKIIPAIYGDIVYDEKKGAHIFSTEDAFSFLINKFHGKKYKVEKVIYLTTVDGVLDKKNMVIPKIKDKMQLKKNLFNTDDFDVTGGMKHKVEQGLYLAKQGIKVYITSGVRKESIYHAVFDQNFYGTIVG